MKAEDAEDFRVDQELSGGKDTSDQTCQQAGRLDKLRRVGRLDKLEA